jgi:DNA mismatch repair protein MutS
VPNSVRLNADERLLIITGPTRAGKSVLVRQVALIVLMAQMGSFVPAASARIALADRIFTRIGASDDIARGRSTFLVEMGETAHILDQATRRSLVILDEVGRGTSTYDGMSLAWAVAADLHDRLGARTLFATHYHELTELPEHLTAARNYNLAVAEREGTVIFLRRLVPGGADKSYGLHVARLAGVPDDVVAHAERIMARFRQDGQGPAGRDSAGSDFEPEMASAGRAGAVREAGSPYLPSADGDEVRQIVRELGAVDIANLTPVQALVALNDWQGRLRDAQAGRDATGQPEDDPASDREG